ncbi:MAG: EamA family transporter [Gemmatimonadetes bacterium]|jgi:drug/metabolite transporter (DMT)-like permease|nr:EamA family transporter [Gemmatimonadota bacterium]MBT6145568.1 EamA family transporter [Gemmatimonadota bacterium]MBT7860924.1 EamA family transporter [Gemmatimonadota bacterium]
MVAETYCLSPVFWLLLSALLSFGFGQLFKWSQRRGCHAPTVVSTNYIVLAATIATGLWVRGSLHVDGSVLWVGMCMGVAFIVSMWTMTRALERAPVSIVLTAFRLAILVPVVVSIVLWGESLTVTQSLGILLALTGVALTTQTSIPHRYSGAWALLAAAAVVFITQGLSQVCLRWVHYAGLDPQRLAVLMICASTAGALGCGIVLMGRHRPQSRELWTGAGIGIYNLIALAVLLTALSRLDGTRFFPVHGCLVVILDGLCAHFIWREPLSRIAGIGVMISALSILLVM